MVAPLTESRSMQIGAVAARSGVNIETVRYYERIRLLPKPSRSAGGRRVYTALDEQRLAFIRRSRELGFSIEEIRTLVALGEGANDNCAEVYGLARGRLGEIRDKIADLKRMEKVLQALVTECAHGTLPHCPIIETLSAAP